MNVGANRDDQICLLRKTHTHKLSSDQQSFESHHNRILAGYRDSQLHAAEIQFDLNSITKLKEICSGKEGMQLLG